METLINVDELKKHESLYQAFQANKDAINELDVLIDNQHKLRVETEEKIKIASEVNLPLAPLRRGVRKINKEIKCLTNMRVAYANGYLEIPELTDWQSQERVEEGENKSWWVFKPTVEVPLRVYQAIKKAKDIGIFDELVVFKKFRKRDPILAGRIKDRYFYLASWR